MDFSLCANVCLSCSVNLIILKRVPGTKCSAGIISSSQPLNVLLAAVAVGAGCRGGV